MGISLQKCASLPDTAGEYLHAPMAVFRQVKSQYQAPVYYLDNVYRIFRSLRINAFTAFSAPPEAEISVLAASLEDRISRIEVRSSYSDIQTHGHTSSRSTDSYYQSFERELLSRLIDNLTEVQMARMSAYKVAFVIELANGHEQVIDFLKANSVLFGTRKIAINGVSDLMRWPRAAAAIPLSYSNASFALTLSDRIRRIPYLRATNSSAVGDIVIGSELDGASEGSHGITMSSHVMNLGTMIAGLPGTGKTKSAMLMIGQALKPGIRLAIISPTGEWNGFAANNSVKPIRLGRSGQRINFFRCENSNRRRFYENLSMLIASGCRAGPYKNSMEKCILSALSKVYSKSSNPDPQTVYEEIEESVIEQHGKRVKSSIKYTKHGENIRAGLESLRQLLMNPEFAYSDGIDFHETISKGAVFDLSELSNSMKPLVYALLLNQVYSICDEFDLSGNDDLRLIICLEEAQLVFNKDEEESATIDLQERIQNFRKSGVALIVICHNITDISPGIRRLCQNKLYFRHSSDVAKFAANDLIFSESDYEEIVGMLKTLDQRVCALSTVIIEDNERKASESKFIKVLPYTEGAFIPDTYPGEEQCLTTVVFTGSNKYAGRQYEIRYLREKVAYGRVVYPETAERGLLKEKRYRMTILAEKRSEDASFDIVGGAINHID